MSVAGNPLLSSKPSESNLTVSLHPLVLLTISDQIVRRRLRETEGVKGLEDPIVGAILGQQKGREITAEHAFPCSVIEGPTGLWELDQEWMERRIQQYKDVHKVPPLDVVGWFTLCLLTGPGEELLPIQDQFTTLYNENAILVALHPEAIADSLPSASGGKLPLSVYESINEKDSKRGDNSMQVDGEENIGIQFRQLPFSIETDETEMIAINFVAKGAGSAGAISTEDTQVSKADEDKKGKAKETATEAATEVAEPVQEATNPLTTEEQDEIAGITTRLNSVRMLQSRLEVISKFMQSLPPSYLSDSTLHNASDPAALPHLRNIQALVTRLALLTPRTGNTSTADGDDALKMAAQAQSNDASLSSLLATISQDLQGLGEMGRKFSAVEAGKAQKNKNKDRYGGSVSFVGEEVDIRPGGAAYASLLS